MMKRNRLLGGCILLLGLMMAGCDRGQSTRSADSVPYTVKATTWHQTHYFTGSVKPLKTVSIVSPVDGTLSSIGVEPGQIVKKGTLLYTITTQLAEKSFQPALTAYLKDKKALADADEKQRNDKFLYDNGIVSRDDYQKSLEAYYTAKLSIL